MPPDDDLHPANGLAELLSFFDSGVCCRVKPADHAAPLLSGQHHLLNGFAAEVIADSDLLDPRFNCLNKT